MSRFVVTELEGFRGVSGGSRPGLSCHVIDTLWNHRLIHTYRTEIGGAGRSMTGRPRSTVRRLAAEHVERLNAGTVQKVYQRLRDHWPCPSCGDQIHERHSRCTSCGSRMR